MKQANLEVVDPTVSDFLWTQFRRWVCAETFKLQDQSYGQAQENFSNLLKKMEGPVLSKLLKEEALPLDIEPWSERRPTSTVQAAEEQVIQAEDLGQAEEATESSEKQFVSEDPQASSLDRQALEDLKRSDMLMNERMDKQDIKIDSIASMVAKQNETSEQIKSMLEVLFTRLPPSS